MAEKPFITTWHDPDDERLEQHMLQHQRFIQSQVDRVLEGISQMDVSRHDLVEQRLRELERRTEGNSDMYTPSTTEDSSSTTKAVSENRDNQLEAALATGLSDLLHAVWDLFQQLANNAITEKADADAFKRAVVAMKTLQELRIYSHDDITRAMEYMVGNSRAVTSFNACVDADWKSIYFFQIL